MGDPIEKLLERALSTLEVTTVFVADLRAALARIAELERDVENAQRIVAGALDDKEQLRTRIAELEAQAGEWNDAVAGARSRAESAEAHLAALHARIAELEGLLRRAHSHLDSALAVMQSLDDMDEEDVASENAFLAEIRAALERKP